jgi:DNA-binding IclR family transcriptional regulator
MTHGARACGARISNQIRRSPDRKFLLPKRTTAWAHWKALKQDPARNEATQEPTEDGETKQRGIQSVDQAIDLLAVFEALSAPMTLKALAQAVDMPMSSVHRYLVSLRRRELIVQDQSTGLYDLGPMALQLGIASMRRMDFLGIAEVTARRVAAQTNQTAFVSIWSDKGPVIVRWIHGAHIIITTASLGSILPIFDSSTGRVFTAFMPANTAEPFFAAATGYSRDELTRLLDSVRDTGYAWITESITPGLFAVAAPVKDWQGNVAATVTLLSKEASLVEFPNDALQCLLAHTDDASRQLGFRKKTQG